MGSPRRGEAGARESLHAQMAHGVLVPYPLRRELAWISRDVASECSDKTIRGILNSLFFYYKPIHR